MTSSHVPSPCPETAKEVKEVTAMLGWLQVQEDLAPWQRSWAYHKLLPGPDDLPSPMLSTIKDILPEEWDNILNPQDAD